MKELTKISILFVALLGVFSSSLAQKKIKIENTETFSGGRKENGEKFNKFIGNVIFTHGGSTFYCDTAIVYQKTNTVEAEGHIRITDNDSVQITAKKLFYNGDTKVAQLRQDVVFVKSEVMTLYTDYLDYFRTEQLAKYFNNGKLVDSTNVLTSRRGYYEVQTDMASFKGNVEGTNEDFTLTSDTLQYNSRTKIIYFRGPAELINNDGDKFNYDEGIYNTNTKQSELQQNIVETKDYILKARNFSLNDRIKYYKGRTDVELIDKENNVIVTGDTGEYWRSDGITKIYDNPLLKVIAEGDTLFLTADTLVAIDSKVEAEKRLLAYPNVKFFKKDLQGVADSIAYHSSDSVMFLYSQPTLWAEANQISADTIDLYIANSQIDKMVLRSASFVISTDSLRNYNQIKGRQMTAYFAGNKISKVDVFGNGESIFFALNDDETEVVGMNKSKSSTLRILFDNNQAKTVYFYSKPDASFIPPHELRIADRQLKGFEWRIEHRPSKSEVVNPKEEVKTAKTQSKPKL